MKLKYSTFISIKVKFWLPWSEVWTQTYGLNMEGFLRNNFWFVQALGKWSLLFVFLVKVVSRESLAALHQEQAERETNNQNPWTFQRVARANMLGIRKVLSPFDIHNHGRYAGKFYYPKRV